MRTNALLICVAVVLLIGRAVDQSFADAGALSEREPARQDTASSQALSVAQAATEPASRSESAHVGVWTRMADCESGDGDGRAPYTASWHFDGYHDGGLQFLPATWNMAKRLREVRAFAAGYGYAHHAPAWVQIRVADNWRRHTSWLQWPECSRRLGLR